MIDARDIRNAWIDADGAQWVYVDTPARPEMVQLFETLAPAFPDADFRVVGDVRGGVSADVPTRWRAGRVAMVELVNWEEMLAGLERIVEEADEPLDPGPLVNINTASAEELTTLPGVGPTVAQRIIDHRPFSTVYSLTEVSGIGDAMLEELEPALHRLTISTNHTNGSPPRRVFSFLGP